MDFGISKTESPGPSQVALDKVFNISEPQFLNIYNVNKTVSI